MSQKNLFSLAIVAAFLFGIGTMVTIQRNILSGNRLQGDLVQEAEEKEQPVPICSVHEDCNVGSVCRIGTCARAERTFCSQPFMLAESLEDKYIRYTLCSKRCVQSGESAYCE